MLLQLPLLVKVCFTVSLYLFYNYYVAPVDLNGIKRNIKGVLVKNQVDLKDAFRLSMNSISDQLLQAGIITQDIHRSSPSYDDIIDSFLSGLTFIRKPSDLKKECNTFLSALSNIGGPVARAAGMLRDEWDQVMHED